MRRKTNDEASRDFEEQQGLVASAPGVRDWLYRTLCFICGELSPQIDALHRKEGMKAMTETFYAALFGYDEVRSRSVEVDSGSVTRVCVLGDPVRRQRAGCRALEEPVQL